jgi:CBS domain-containing protein
MTTATISDFMTTRIEPISPSYVQEAAKKMTDRDVSSLVVIDNRDSKVLGLITERDIVRDVCIYDNVSTNSVKNPVFYHLAFPLIITKSNSSVEDATDLLVEKKIRQLLVVDKEDANKPVGLVAPMYFTRYMDIRRGDNENNAISRILEYYRD